MLTRMVLICWPRDPPASASQSAGIMGLSHRARPGIVLLLQKWASRISKKVWALNTKNEEYLLHGFFINPNWEKKLHMNSLKPSGRKLRGEIGFKEKSKLSHEVDFVEVIFVPVFHSSIVLNATWFYLIEKMNACWFGGEDFACLILFSLSYLTYGQLLTSLTTTLKCCSL